jgi:polygalacturonase
MMRPPRLRQQFAGLLPLIVFCAGAWAQDFYLAEPQLPQIPNRIFKLTDFRGVGDGKTLNTEAFRDAINACKAAGGGTVVVPSGVFLTGPIKLVSHMALLLEKGAVLKASEKLSEFGLPDPLPTTQAEIDALKAGSSLISGAKLTDIAIRGEGTIDGNGVYWWARAVKAPAWAAESIGLSVPKPPPPAPSPAGSPKSAGSATAAGSPAESPPAEKPLILDNRPNMVVLRECERIHVQGVTFLNPPKFHFVPGHCRELLIEDVKMLAPTDSPNTDGIDPGNCQNVLIRRCLIATGDDNIALKSGRAAGTISENITVTDCVIGHGHGISVGSQTESGVRNFLVQNCTFEGTDNGLRIKSDRKRGGTVENVTYRNITMKNVAIPITIFLFYDDKKAAVNAEPQPVTDSTPIVRGIRFLNVACDGAAKKAGEIIGLPESPAADIRLENVRIVRAAAPFTIQNVKNFETKGMEIVTLPESPAPSTGETPTPKP